MNSPLLLKRKRKKKLIRFQLFSFRDEFSEDAIQFDVFGKKFGFSLIQINVCLKKNLGILSQLLDHLLNQSPLLPSLLQSQSRKNLVKMSITHNQLFQNDLFTRFSISLLLKVRTFAFSVESVFVLFNMFCTVKRAGANVL